MIKIYSDTKIYIHCPAGVVTGGVELLHQLAHNLRENGLNAYIVYYGREKHDIPADYMKYNISFCEEIEDSERNVEVFNESIFDRLLKGSKTQKFLWWLSVDHFYLNTAKHLNLLDFAKYDIKKAMKEAVKRCARLIIKGESPFRGNISLKFLKSSEAVHGYQSEYCQNFLQNHEFNEIVSLKDYINTDYLDNFSTKGKEDIVLYNPKKGIKFTKKIMAASADLRWTPICNMSRKQVVEVMRKAKLYVDFGYHPGKDRLPRECAASGCCIITGRRGAANFFEDVAVPNRYKFDERHASISEIVNVIKDTLQNYDNRVNDFMYYRNCIAYEKEEFENQVKRIFHLMGG